jgi:MtN3 and saliva related transmembrane protein
MLFTVILGYVAGALLIISMVPQIVKSWKTKSTKDISLMRYIIYTLGVILWLWYGFLMMDGPIIFINAVSLVLASSILFLKIKYG